MKQEKARRETRITPTDEAYGELTLAYDFFNRALFDGALPGALITLTRQDNVCGYFSGGRFASKDASLPPGRRQADEISMNPTLFGSTPVEDVLSTLVHECVHQWQHYFGKPGRGRYHNNEWATKMEEIGLIPSSTGRPGGARTGDQMSDYIDPKGKFARLCAELLAGGFRITWYDRFVPEPPVRPTYASPVRELLMNIMQGDAGFIGADDRDLVDGDGDGVDVDGADVTAISPFSIANEVPFEDREFRVPEPRADGTVANSNRCKYACVSGQHAVWGKPGLRLSCDDCGGPFSPVTAETSLVAREYARTRARRRMAAKAG